MTLERRHLGNHVYVLVSTTLERAGFLAAFTERIGGVSLSPFASLNCSLVTDDEAENGRQNWVRVVEALRIPPFATGYQVHGARVARLGLRRKGAGYSSPGTRIPGTDGLLTKMSRVPLAVLAADCLPIVLASPQEGTIAAVHAGWRGLAAGILPRAVGAFQDPADVRAVIGPGIGPDHYRVGEEVARAVAAASGAGAVTTRGRSSLHLDLAASARVALAALGVRRVEVAEVCTACEPERFFSHRRDGPTGRQLGLAMRL